MTEGNLAKWVVKEGDKIKSGQVIAEIETDKATMEVEAVDEGVMGKIMVAAGTEGVKVNQLIALLLEDGEDAGVIEKYENSRTKELETSPKPENAAKPKEMATIPTTSSSTPVLQSSNSRLLASPLAKRIAANESIDLRMVQGTGPHGRIVKDDVLKVIASGGTSSGYEPAAQSRSECSIHRRPLQRRRRHSRG